jgi:Amt family ammonium transporter
VVDWRTRSKVDDTLDVFPCHGVGGIVGMILTGVFAHKKINGAVEHNGLFFGEITLFKAHIIGLFASAAFILIVAFLLLKITDLISPLRASEEEELLGMDISQHAEKL